MGQYNYKKGDIVCCSQTSTRIDGIDFSEYLFKPWDVGTNFSTYYGIVCHIKDKKTLEIFDEYEIITGQGNRNSNVLIGIILINRKFEVLNKILYFNPHNVTIARISSDINTLEKQINTLKSIRDVGSNYYRRQKLKRILK